MAPPLFALSLVLLIVILPAEPAVAAACGGLAPPVRGRVVARFAPAGRYAGHWGVDFGVPPGTPVRASGPGTVTFAGSVAGRRSVTIHHGGSLRTSYSYLGGIAVRRGSRVRAGAVVAVTGAAHGSPALHWSARIGGRYVDPLRLLRCLPPPQRAVRLVRRAAAGGRRPYAGRRASRHPRRDVRSPARGSSHRRRGRVSRPPARRRDLPPGRRAVAEGEPGGVRR